MLSVLTRLGLSNNSIAPSIDIDDDLPPPMFPALNSIQRSKPSMPSTSDLLPTAPPPPSFSFTVDEDEESDDGNDKEDYKSPQRTEKTNLVAPTSTVKLAKRVKVAIEPGYSQLDWARLKSSGVDLRGGETAFLRVTPTMLAQHKSREDCWQVYNGKVYNVTPYLRYHPGGAGEMMRAAGKDGTELFMKTHAWINAESMMEGCMIGYLIRE